MVVSQCGAQCGASDWQERRCYSCAQFRTSVSAVSEALFAQKVNYVVGCVCLGEAGKNLFDCSHNVALKCSHCCFCCAINAINRGSFLTLSN